MNLKKKFILIYKKNYFNFIKFGGVKRKSGINFSGKKTCRNRGFISKKKIKNIDYFRAFWHVEHFIVNFEYDSNRKTLLSVVQYNNQSFSYIISIEGLKIYTYLMNSNYLNVKIGSSTIIKNVNKVIKISNIETYKCSGSKLLRSSASYGKLKSKNRWYSYVILKSKKVTRINSYSSCVIGKVLNFNYTLNKYRKASYSRFKGFRPKVRGVAMNPVDHPHGGGEGKKSKKMNPMSPWGKKLNNVKR